MENNAIYNTYERFLITKNNVIIEVNRDFLQLIRYTESELVGKTLLEVAKLLRIDSQVNLEEFIGSTKIIIFTKDLVAIEGRISCKNIDNGPEKIYSFHKDIFQSASKSFDTANQIGLSRGNGVAIFKSSNLVLISANQIYLNFWHSPYNKGINIMGKNIMEIMPEGIATLSDNLKKHVIKTGNPYYVEELKINLGPEGETYWNMSLVPIFENEKIEYLLLYTSNETEKVLNRKSLEQKNKDLETIIENMSDEIIIFDKHFNIEAHNQKIKEQLPSHGKNLKIPNNIDEIFKLAYVKYQECTVYDEDNQLIPYGSLPYQRVAKGERITNFFIKQINYTGIKYREVNGYPIYDELGNFIRGIMIYRNIDDRIEREELRLIETQKQILTKIVESMELEYIRCTYPDLEIISINDKAMDKLKRINNEIKSGNSPIGKSSFELCPIDLEKKMENLEFHLMEKGEKSYTDYQNYIIDGEERFFKTINEPIFGLNNKIAEIMFITTDITEEVQEKYKLEESLEIQNQVFATISHELNTPLSVIFSATQLIERSLQGQGPGFDKEDISKKISIIKQNCYRFTKLINNIIDLSSIESGFYKLNLSNRNIVEIVEDIVDSVRSYVENTGLFIIFDTEVEEKIMAVDVDKMERVILNLISNAVKFSPKGETIYINIEDKEDYLVILVRDCGIGISPQHLDSIFDRYRKVDNSLTRNAEGSGLGLALVETILKSMGGEISVESQLGKGSSFTIKLPVNSLAESEVAATMEDEFNRVEQLNIEFSDIYTK